MKQPHELTNTELKRKIKALRGFIRRAEKLLERYSCELASRIPKEGMPDEVWERCQEYMDS